MEGWCGLWLVRRRHEWRWCWDVQPPTEVESIGSLGSDIKPYYSNIRFGEFFMSLVPEHSPRRFFWFLVEFKLWVMIPDKRQGHGQSGRVAEWQSDRVTFRLSACPPVLFAMSCLARSAPPSKLCLHGDAVPAVPPFRKTAIKQGTLGCVV